MSFDRLVLGAQVHADARGDDAYKGSTCEDQPTTLTVSEEERHGCDKWLRRMDFLIPGRDDDIWENIKVHWEKFLARTRSDPFQAETIHQACVQLFSDLPNGYRRGAFDAANLGQNFDQAVWITLVAFLAHVCLHEPSALAKLGLTLSYHGQKTSLTEATYYAYKWERSDFVRLERVWFACRGFLMTAIMSRNPTARNNPLIWWICVMARSRISGKIDDIRPGRLENSPLPIEVDMGTAVSAMLHLGKVLLLSSAIASVGWEFALKDEERCGSSWFSEHEVLPTEILEDERKRRLVKVMEVWKFGVMKYSTLQRDGTGRALLQIKLLGDSLVSSPQETDE